MTKTELSDRIGRALSAGDLATVQRLATVGQHLEEIAKKEAALAEEKALLNRELNGTGSGVRHPALTRSVMRNGDRQVYSRGNLLIELDLPGTGKVRIAERTAAESLVVLMERLLASLGSDALSKLQRLRTGRGPLISERPERDFRNSKRDDIYGHRKIPGTDLYVLTHSSTLEKVGRIKEALRFLGLPQGSYRVVKTD